MRFLVPHKNKFLEVIKMQIWSGNKNMEAFHKMEKELIAKHHGKTAIFCDGKLTAIGKDINDAIKKANIPKKKEIFVRELYKPEEQTEAIL